jgi:hypothetical protein
MVLIALLETLMMPLVKTLPSSARIEDVILRMVVLEPPMTLSLVLTTTFAPLISVLMVFALLTEMTLSSNVMITTNVPSMMSASLMVLAVVLLMIRWIVMMTIFALKTSASTELALLLLFLVRMTRSLTAEFPSAILRMVCVKIPLFKLDSSACLRIQMTSVLSLSAKITILNKLLNAILLLTLATMVSALPELVMKKTVKEVMTTLRPLLVV